MARSMIDRQSITRHRNRISRTDTQLELDLLAMEMVRLYWLALTEEGRSAKVGSDYCLFITLMDLSHLRCPPNRPHVTY